MTRRARGVTLIEMLCVMAVFGLVLTSVLSFYSWGASTTSATSQKMQIYRATLIAVDRVAALAGSAQLVYVDSQQVIFCPLGSKNQPSRVDQTLPAKAITVAVQPASGPTPAVLLWRTNGRTEPILDLEASQTLSFASDGNTFTITSSDAKILFDGPKGPATAPMQITRTAVLPAWVAPGTVLPELY